MASPGNRHCANCIGTLSFPIRLLTYLLTSLLVGAARGAGSMKRYGVRLSVRLSVPAWALSSKPAPAGLLAGRRYRSQILQQRWVNAGSATSSACVQGFI